MLIKNVDIWQSKGLLKNCFIRIEDKKIAELGIMANCPNTDDVLDGKGCTAYPGFIDGHCHLGMFGDGLGFEGDDGNEDTDPCTPQLRAIDAVNPRDRGFAEALEAGITTVVTGPGSANAIGGQMCAVKTKGRLLDDMLVKAPAAMKMAFGENPKTVYNGRSQMPTTRMATAAIIRDQLFKAKKYMHDMELAAKDEDMEEPEFDIKCEALLPVLRRELAVHIHAHRADDIASAIRICKEFSLKYVLVHCTEGYLMSDILAKEKASAICGPIIGHRSKPELVNSTMSNGGILEASGVTVSICTDHPEIPVNFLAISAGLCVREGMSFSAAIDAITIVPAMQCGIENRVGSITAGKDADILLFAANPLTLEAKPAAVIIDGEVAHNNL